jgi:hypothetical protein
MSLKIRAEDHARKMKVISVDISFMGKYLRAPGAVKRKKTKAGCTYSSEGSKPLHHLESSSLVMSMECITF